MFAPHSGNSKTQGKLLEVQTNGHIFTLNEQPPKKFNNHTNIYTYIYIYMYVHAHIYIYIYIYTYGGRGK